MKKIILIGTVASSTIQFRQDLIKLLAQNKWQVYTFVCEYKDDELKTLESLGATPITYKMSRGGLNPFADIASMWDLKKKITKIKPDIVFSYFSKPVVYGTIAAKLAKTPKIIGMLEGLGTPFTIPKNGQSTKVNFIQKAQIFLYRLAFPFLDKIIFLNPDDPVDLIEKNKIKCKTNAIHVLGAIGLNLDQYPYSPWQNNTFSFIFIARLLAEKGIFEYVEATKLVKKQYPNVVCTVIGGLDKENPSGLTERELERLINDNIIEYPGFVNNVPDYITKSAVFILPSYYREGVPRSTQEAMAIGRPIITTDVPGCRETVIDGQNGFLVPKWDANALADKMIYFIEHPEQVNIMGKESYKLAKEHFDADKVNRKLCNIIGIELS
ncbi:glycosyltransferase family 4 protein [Ignatzschineria sp. RMDPL8A]|uniref:glycosyltransferase family 4 protein n=1 Tax=Ignatzschineria sp. RMDPL8A TaxID=2999236 RepID=UPI0024467279|nr:glycosyltransferase family 4 protein [Ignatzschineria sp. RMDPL8A]MDG9729829.1 glycosyltransferase family 4 protein [Ignatzschineria sp. RMDPL8A]